MAPIPTKRRKLSHSPETSEDDDMNSRLSALGSKAGAQVSRRVNGTSSINQPQNVGKPASYSKLSQTATDELLLSHSSQNSSLLKLQLDELLAEVKPDYASRTAQVQKPLFRLKEIIESIAQHPAELPLEAEKRLKKSGIVVPFPAPRPTKEAKYKFEYFPPADINVVGNLALKIGSKNYGLDHVDLAITLPAQAFQEKDFLNYRYFHKRAYFIATFASAIRNAAGAEFDVVFALHDEVELLPCIVVTPGEEASSEFKASKCQIRIITSIQSDLFSLDKTNLSRNCARPKGSSDGLNDLKPTPLYNSTLRSEASLTPYLGYLNRTLRTCEAFRDACLLASVWLHQRGYDSRVSAGGFGLPEWALATALLLEGGGPKGKPLFSPRYNSYQLFKGLLQVLASRDLCDPLVIGSALISVSQSSTPVLYDAHRGVNILNKMTSWSYKTLRHDAKATLDASNVKMFDKFESMFISRLDNSILRFDQLARINLSSLDQSISKEVCEKLYNVLVRGFSDRARLISLRTPSVSCWPVNKHMATPADNALEIGFLLDTENANRVVDRGPMAEEKEAADDFRNFWGEKAELRRFRDGTISESLVWSETAPQSIVHQILSVLLVQHFDCPPSAISMIGDSIQRDVDIQSAQKSFQAMIETFQSFSSKMHALEGVPLAIRSISAADEHLRFASLYDPLKSMRPADIVVQFEASNRWPDDLAAIQRTKIAFLTKIGDLLEADSDPLSTRVGLENTHSNLLNVAYLDIFFPAGITFRLRIQHEREQALLERQLKDKELPGRNRDELAQALASYKRHYVHAPRHTQAIRALCTRFPALPMAIRFLKKWISSHLLSPFFTSELLELLASQVFLRPQPWTTPATPFTAFLRILNLVSRWDWSAEPLVIDFSNGEDMTPSDLSIINTNFQAWRRIDPAMNNVVLFAASNLDPSGVAWTQNSQPPRVVAIRLTSLARAAISTTKEKGLHSDMLSLFQSPLTHFDFLLHLKPSLVQSVYRHQKKSTSSSSSSSKYKNLQLDHLLPSGPVDPESVDYNPIQLYLSDLRHSFNQSIVLFFHDADAGSVIAGLWNPRTVGNSTKEFRVRMGVSTMPAATSSEEDEDEDEDMFDGADGQEEGKQQRGQVVVNKKGMLAEMAMLGDGIVEKVQVLKE